jgi:glycosyltransferase involved in cell wall biosynthesis
MREKGIRTAISAVQKVNETYGRTICTLDIFGQVDPKQTQWFEQLTSSFPEYIRYCGIVSYDKSVEIIKEYYALLFPTEFFTEGIPGTIIDAYAAGVPVIASKWESFSDIIEDEITGIGYSFDHSELLSKVLFDVIERPEIINKMKINCLKKAKEYLPERVIEILLLRLV